MGTLVRPDTKERPFKCLKCRSTFVRRDLLLRHDRTVHAKDGGPPLHGGEAKRRATGKTSPGSTPRPLSKSSVGAIDPAALEQIEVASDGIVDLETAAMLMTDLHHKATAAFADPGRDHDGGVGVGVGGGGGGGGDDLGPVTDAALLDPSVAYAGSSVLPPPPMPWDAFMPPVGPMAHQAHSIASSISGSQDSQASHPSLTSVSTAQAQLDPPSPVEVRARPVGGGGGGGVAMTSMPAPLTTAAGPYSPHPLIAAPPSPPRVYTRSPTPVGPTMSSSTMLPTPRLATDEERTKVIDAIRAEDPDSGLVDTLRLPALNSLNRYLSTYFNLFHHHLPFLHPASFRPVDVSPALLLAVLSIGALYTFDHERAYMLHIGSKVLVSRFLQNKENFSSRKCPLWTMQASLVNMIFASWSGDAKGLEWTCSIKGLLANVSLALAPSFLLSFHLCCSVFPFLGRLCTSTNRSPDGGR